MFRKAGVLAAGGLALGLSARAQTPPKFVNGPGSTLAQNPRPKATDTAPLPVGLQLMARWDLLPKLRDSICLQDSSYDRTGGNGDLGNFVRREGNKAVLADIKGPGCIYRFWSANAAGHLRIFFDGEETPRIDCPTQDFFLGKVAPFVTPIVGHKSGGWYCFFPMPFAKSCRVEVTDPGPMYYHVEYQRFSDGTSVRTFTNSLTPQDQAALDTIRAQWNHLGDDPRQDTPAQKSINGKTQATAGAQTALTAINGSGVIRQISMKVTPADRYTLRQTVLRIYWDGAQKPAIEVPLGDFFGVGFGDRRFKAMPCAMTDDGYVAYWPMPFQRSARFELVNASKTNAPQIEWQIKYDTAKQPLKNAGYFHAQWHQQTTTAGEPFHILKVSGRGHYVGEHTDMQGDRGIWFLEGDEKVYVDGETFPSIYGTGTEDFYTGGWYFDEGPFNLAYHGCTVKEDGISRVSAYRYQIQDCVPFQKDLTIDIEHGPVNDYPGAVYSCVAYWYQTVPEHDWSPIDRSTLTPTDYHIGGALEGESLTFTGGKTSVTEDSKLGAEASNGKVVAISGEAATFGFDVKDEDVYSVQFSQVLQKDSAVKANATLDGAEATDLSKTVDLALNNTVDIKPGERVEAFQALRLTPGHHTFTLHLPADKTLYLDYVRLLPSHREPGVTEAESLVEKADTGGKGTVERQDGAEEFSGRSGLVWMPAGAGATLKLPVSVPTDGDYNVEVGAVRDENSPVLGALLDETPLLESVDVSGPQGGSAVQRIRFGRVVGLKAGAHTLTLLYKSGRTMRPSLQLDYIRLAPSRYPDTIEVESLKVLAAKDGEATTQEMKGFGKDWSDNAQFWFLAQKEGAEATLELLVQTAGKYRIVAYFTTAKDYGTVQTLIDGNAIGAPTDTYTEKVLAKGRTELGVVDLTAGTHRLTFRVVGKNAQSVGYLVGVDALGLEPVK